jgi:hypothetical protein
MTEDEKYIELLEYSNPERVRRNLDKYLGKDIPLYISTRRNKKYMIQRLDGKFIHFGQFNPPMKDFTHHKNDIRRINYLRRATHIKGDWREDKYSPNNLSINLLWQ